MQGNWILLITSLHYFPLFDFSCMQPLCTSVNTQFPETLRTVFGSYRNDKQSPYTIFLSLCNSSHEYRRGGKRSTENWISPRSSFPLRPALPLIWMYSPEVTHLKPAPSNFLALVNTTVFAGILRPVENVSVANRACNMHSHQKRWSDFKPDFTRLRKQNDCNFKNCCASDWRLRLSYLKSSDWMQLASSMPINNLKFSCLKNASG